MIQLGAAMLCDAASVRENLIHVLGGGITRLGRSNYPAPLGCDLALTFYVPYEEGRSGLHVAAFCPDPESGGHLFGFEATINMQVDSSVGPQSASLVVPFAGMGIPAPGRYSIEVVADGSVIGSVPFTAVIVDVPEMPSASA